MGFASWAYEVQQQEAELGIFFDTIIVCAVTGSTQAGMIAGFAGQDRPRRVIGIPVQSTLDAIRLSGRLEGMIIDPVYEGKSMAGLIDLVHNADIGRDSTVLYAHPGRPAGSQRIQRLVPLRFRPLARG